VVKPRESFTRKHLDAPEWAVVLVVPCEGEAWTSQLTARFSVDRDGDYPHNDYFESEAFRGCPEGRTTFLAPTEDGWRDGDRGIRFLRARVPPADDPARPSWRAGARAIHDGCMSDPVAIDEFVTVETEGPPHRRELHAREERRARLAAFEFRGDDALFRFTGAPDAFTAIEGGTFAASDGRRFRISWVKHLIDEGEPPEPQRVYRAVALVRRIA